MEQKHPVFFDQMGRLRSGWRAALFMFVFALTAMLLGAIAIAAMKAAGVEAGPGTSSFLMVSGAISLGLAILYGWLLGWRLEGLPFRALGASFTPRWFRHLVFGSAAGVLTLCLAIAVAAFSGGLSFEANTAAQGAIAQSLVTSFFVFAIAAAFEEVLFRGYILQTFARSGLAWLAVLLTSLFFGAVHLGNPNSGYIATLNTVIAGVWFSVAYLKTRDLWFVWGLHLMWNWVQGSIFGIEVSGLTEISTAPVLKEVETGPVWLTGGDYGLEAGIACTIALIISTAVIYYRPWLKPDEEMLELTSKREPLA